MSTRLDPISAATASALFAAAGLHVAWGRGSPVPYDTVDDLVDQVVGSSTPPSPPACYGVAALLGSVGLAVVRGPRSTSLCWLLRGAASVLAVRGCFGFAGRTDLLVPGSTSSKFRRNDRRFFAPLCLLLAAGIGRASRRGSHVLPGTRLPARSRH